MKEQILISSQREYMSTSKRSIFGLGLNWSYFGLFVPVFDRFLHSFGVIVFLKELLYWDVYYFYK